MEAVGILLIGILTGILIMVIWSCISKTKPTTEITEIKEYSPWHIIEVQPDGGLVHASCGGEIEMWDSLIEEYPDWVSGMPNRIACSICDLEISAREDCLAPVVRNISMRPKYQKDFTTKIYGISRNNWVSHDMHFVFIRNKKTDVPYLKVVN